MIDINMDSVVVFGQTVHRPACVSRMQWHNVWENFQFGRNTEYLLNVAVEGYASLEKELEDLLASLSEKEFRINELEAQLDSQSDH